MRSIVKHIFVLISGCVFFAGFSSAEERQHPNLIVTTEDIQELRAGYKDAPAFYESFASVKNRVDLDMENALVVPFPEDAGGGYTHEQHKRNYKSILNAGTLYQITGQEKYATYAKKILLAYADLYPTLDLHPERKSDSPGRIFWQSLNEAVWLVHTIQGYDLIVDTLTEGERLKIENELLRKVASFLSEGQPQVFNKVHNHGTWAAAGVGMTGYVLGDQSLVDQALYGLDKSGTGGFMRQLDELFSPDGYYNEGPYYQRYALMPFVLFAKAIQTNEPERRIFEYRDNILMKAITTTVDLSYNGLFFPINDAIKDKSIATEELKYGISIAYGLTGDTGLLSVAEEQNGTVLTGDGLKLAAAMSDGLAKPYPFKSMMLTDGLMGDQGALVIMRSDNQAGHQALIAKNTSQGMGHGHFDRLNWLFYDNGHEIVQDYGAARFLNVEAKYGGHYLPENTSWAKQTIAHNSLVVDETSHFEGDSDLGDKHATKVLFNHTSDALDITSATIDTAYDGVKITRTMAMLKDPSLEYPLILDVLQASSASMHQYDLPVHFSGHLIEWNFPIVARDNALRPLGDENGYQHLWLLSEGKPEGTARITWQNDNRFYTLSTLTTEGSEILFTRLGANDPNFNLRPEQNFIHRVPVASDQTFISVLEPHGEYNPVLEFTTNSHSQIVGIDHVEESLASVILVKTVSGKTWGLGIAPNAAADDEHNIIIDGNTLSWRGHFKVFSLYEEGEQDGS